MLIEDFFNLFRFEVDLSSLLLMFMFENFFFLVLINIVNNFVFERFFVLWFNKCFFGIFEVIIFLIFKNICFLKIDGYYYKKVNW